MFKVLILSVMITSQCWAAMLPQRAEMRKRLIQVLDEPRVRSEFYPLLLCSAGSEKTPQQVVDLFNRNLEVFLGRMSPREARQVRPQIEARFIPLFRSVLADDPEEAQRAVDLFLAG